MLTDSRAACKGKRGASAWVVAFAKAVAQEQAGRVRFVLPRKGYYSQREITDLLERYGIRTRRYKHDGTNTYFVVRGSQAEWAIRVIEQSGGELWDPAGRSRRQGQSSNLPQCRPRTSPGARPSPGARVHPAATKSRSSNLLTRIKNG